MAAQGLGHDTHGLSLDRVHAHKRPSLPSWHLVSCLYYKISDRGNDALLHYICRVCIQISDFMIQNRRKNTIAIVRVVIVGAARVDIAEAADAAVVRAAEPPPTEIHGVSFLMHHSLRSGFTQFCLPFQAVHIRTGARIWNFFILLNMCFSFLVFSCFIFCCRTIFFVFCLLCILCLLCS